MKFDFGELKNDTNFVAKVRTSQEAIGKVEKAIQKAMDMKNDELSAEDQLKISIFLTYAVNSLYFMYLKVTGDNLSTHPIKHELGRIKEAMERQKQIADNEMRPKLNTNAAKRFVKSGLYDHKQKNEEFRKKHAAQKIYIHNNPNPQNRKRKFDDA